jgi:hypothetical protein
MAARKWLWPCQQNKRHGSPLALPRPYVSEDALDELHTVAPGWDRQFLLAKYMDWIADKEQPRDIDRAFIGWVKSFTKGQAASIDARKVS